MHACLKALNTLNACHVQSVVFVSKITPILQILVLCNIWGCGLCVLNLHIPIFDDCKNICTMTLSSSHHQIKACFMSHCLWLGREKMAYVVCLIMFLCSTC